MTKTNKMLRLKSLLLLLACCFLGLFHAAAQKQRKTGFVSYLSGENVYVRFKNTEGFSNGDTLYIDSNESLVPALTISHHSSISCLCKTLGTHKLKVNDTIIGLVTYGPLQISDKVIAPIAPDKDVSEEVIDKKVTQKEAPQKNERNEDISGKLVLSSYANFSKSSGNTHRFRYTFSLNAENISDSKLSFESYISFHHKLNEWNLVRENLNNALKIYALSVSYDFSEHAKASLGRKINPHIANIGAVDGVQAEIKLKYFYTGAVLGFRPDYYDYGINGHLPEFGVYIGHKANVGNGFTQSSLALFEQQNGGKTDRRFAYFQHSDMLIKNLTFFGSFELDLYRLQNGQPTNSLSLTSLYLSLNYRFSSKLSLFGSYDNRKNVIYYETFRNLTDEIIEQASRQGFRFRITGRPFKYLLGGITVGHHNRAGDIRPTRTLRAYISHTNIPQIRSSLSLSSNFMQTPYLDGQTYGVRLTKNWLNGKLYSMLYFREVYFDYTNTATRLNQQIAELDLSYQLNKQLYLSVDYEATFQQQSNYGILYMNMRYRF